MKAKRKARVEWQVLFYVGDTIHLHMFRSEARARRFAASRPVPVIHEGGLMGEKCPVVRKLVRHWSEAQVRSTAKGGE